ncbi:chemokine-binding protein [Pseudocowpox virus]|uniref:Chemokine-binding protein n=1 Tax=Pseudocowpox virus TaxID=129726 RepID=D3IZD0_9POXV|nr:chemokine-binding protein [Pseudocowpox virus]
MKAVVLLLALVGVFTNALPLKDQHYGNFDSAAKEKFCLTHEETYAKFRLQMRVGVKHSPLYEPNNMCMLDLESTRLDTDDISIATAEASGINVSIALVVEQVHIPFSYIGVGFNPVLSNYVYLNVSSWSPWNQLTADLSEHEGWGIKQILETQKLFIQIGCDHQKFPEEPTPMPTPPQTPTPILTPSPLTTPDTEEDYEYYDATPTPADLNVNRKRNPAELDFSLIADPRCVESVDLHVELKDACMNYKHTTPLRLRGEYGKGEETRKEIKELGSNYLMCSMNMNPDDK